MAVEQVLAQSALRRAAREQLRRCGFQTTFVHLTGTPALIGQRLVHRQGHFAGAELLASQYVRAHATQNSARDGLNSGRN